MGRKGNHKTKNYLRSLPKPPTLFSEEEHIRIQEAQESIARAIKQNEIELRAAENQAKLEIPGSKDVISDPQKALITTLVDHEFI